ncbi:hypothetical protein QE152_g21897 [Popillia japonica]|uniref:Uncharacterized protein n=1 Tax=Popillia japonica TaxID=7064 RepID=A0AAW1KMK2_POPJA
MRCSELRGNRDRDESILLLFDERSAAGYDKREREIEDDANIQLFTSGTIRLLVMAKQAKLIKLGHISSDIISTLPVTINFDKQPGSRRRLILIRLKQTTCLLLHRIAVGCVYRHGPSAATVIFVV